MMTELPWYNKGLFSSLNLRQKTLLTIGLTALALLVIFLSGLMIDANLPTDFAIKMQPPSFEHIFGTDWMGRDMFIRTIKGLSLSIIIGLGASIISSIIAVILAFISSINRVCDEFVAWLIDLFASIPHILLIMMISIALGKGAFGQVVRCFDHKTKENVALKIIINTQQMGEQGKQEMEILGSLNELDVNGTSHIVRLLDTFVFRKSLSPCDMTNSCSEGRTGSEFYARAWIP